MRVVDGPVPLYAYVDVLPETLNRIGPNDTTYACMDNLLWLHLRIEDSGSST